MPRTGLRTSLINLAIRGIVKPRLAACRTPLDVLRAFDPMPGIAPRGVRFSQDRLGGVAGEWAAAKHGDGGFGALLYLHGGGYASMSARTHRAITGGFARRGLRVFAPDYRLAPEHQFPAALEMMRRRPGARCALKSKGRSSSPAIRRAAGSPRRSC